MLRKAVLVGQFPPPVHGLSKALMKVADSTELQENYQMEKIDIKNNKLILITILRLLKTNGDFFYFTISHSKGGNARDLLLLMLMHLRRKPVVIHYHGGHFKQLLEEVPAFQRSLNKRLLAKSACVVVLSESLKALFQPFIPEKKLVICENFVESEALISNKELENKIHHMRGKKVLFLSNFIASKGYMDVLEAARLLKDEKDNVFHFAGAFFDSEEEKRFMKKVKEEKLTNVNFHGVVSGQEKKDLLQLCNVFVLPTYYPNEGQPISIIEAMANGLSVVTTRHAGIPDIVDERNGYFVPKQSAEALAQCLKKITVEDLKHTAQVNREYALRNFKETDYTKRIEEIFQRAVPAENRVEAV